MEGKLYRGMFGQFYTVRDSIVLVGESHTGPWRVSRYAYDLAFSQDGIDKGITLEIPNGRG